MAKNSGIYRFQSQVFHVCQHAKSCNRKGKIKGNTNVPRNVEIIDLMEKLLSRGYSSVHTRLGFDTEMFTPKSKEYLDEKDNIVDDLGNLYREKDEKCKRKVLMGRLYELWKSQDLKTENKPIYNICLNGEEKSSRRRIFSKIFKLDKNNQYGFAITKPLPIGIFIKEEHVDIEILNASIANFDLNAKIGEIFIVDIEFNAYDDPRKKMYNEVYPCIFQPKSKVSVDRRSVYQLLSTMRMGRKDNILKSAAT